MNHALWSEFFYADQYCKKSNIWMQNNIGNGAQQCQAAYLVPQGHIENSMMDNVLC